MSENLELFQQRKSDHVRLSLDDRTQHLSDSEFKQVYLKHKALPEKNFSDVNLETKIFKTKAKSPHFVSSMTAGHTQGVRINHIISEAAEQTGWVVALGSQKNALLDKRMQSEYTELRKAHPTVRYLSNIGIEELIQYDVRDVLGLASIVEAEALIVHLNPLQEVFQNKGDVIFRGGFKAIENLVKKSNVPIVVKEVGFGIDLQTAKKLFSLGVSAVDVAGKGGTHWGQIESMRSQISSEAFNDWGYTTVECLTSLKAVLNTKSVWASGGIRNGVDSAKCLALGAKAVGIAQPIMKAAVADSLLNSCEQTVSVMQKFDFELKTAVFLTGCQNPQELYKAKVSYGRK